MRRAPVLAAVIGLVLVILVVLGVREAGRVVRRPEGAAERFVQAASRRGARDRAKAATYGSPVLAQSLVDFTRKDKNEDWFTRIEVGRAQRTGGIAYVPVKVTRNDSAKTKEARTATVVRQPGKAPQGWKVTDIGPRIPGQRVPSEGGSKPAAAPLSTWLLALAVGIGITAVSEAVLRAVGARPAAGRGAPTAG